MPCKGKSCVQRCVLSCVEGQLSQSCSVKQVQSDLSSGSKLILRQNTLKLNGLVSSKGRILILTPPHPHHHHLYSNFDCAVIFTQDIELTAAVFSFKGTLLLKTPQSFCFSFALLSRVGQPERGQNNLLEEDELFVKGEMIFCCGRVWGMDTLTDCTS